MILIIRGGRKRLRRILLALTTIILLAVSSSWWGGALPSTAVWQPKDDIPSGNPLRVNAPVYDDEGWSRLVLKLQNFYLED